MNYLAYFFQKIAHTLPLLLGVSLISFFLMVYFGPDKTYELIGKNPSQEEIDSVRHELGYDKPFLQRYFEYLKKMSQGDFGYSDSSGQKVSSLFSEALPVTLALSLPGFILGDLLAILIGLLSAYYRGHWIDRSLMALAVVGMSTSLLVVAIIFQTVFCSSYGLDLFPVQGWSTNSWFEYLSYVSIPTLTSIFVSIGYNARFYRAVIVDEMNRDHVRTARAFGCPPFRLMIDHVLRNSLVPILTRIIFTLPFVLVGGTLVIERFFGIPGMGLLTYNAITSGDQPVLMAVVTLTAALFVICLTLADLSYAAVDPRVKLGSENA